jgi:hypothetical protein
MKKKSQNQILVEWFDAGNTLTVAEAISNPKIRVYALSQRCGEINASPKKYGIEIDSVTVFENDKHFSRYFKKIPVDLFTASKIQKAPEFIRAMNSCFCL